MKTIEITMVAASRVGKTSLLAAMYQHIKPAFDQTDCYIQPVNETVHELQDRQIELSQMFASSHTEEFSGGGITASLVKRDYRFRIGKKGRNTDLEIAFIDMPGGKYTAKDSQIIEEVDAQIRRSFATIIPIDIAALFENNGSFHQIVNQPTHISTLYERTLKNLEQGEQKLVIVTPIKCEKYLQKPGGMQAILDKLLEQPEYQSLLKLIRSNGLKEYVKVAVCPVQTVGGIHVVRTQLDRYGNPEHILQRVGSYNPQNCHLPLLYLFFSILQMTKDSRKLHPIIDWLRLLFQMDKHLEQAIQIMINDIKTARQRKEIRILQQPLQNCTLIL